ncbi:MAG: 50S ribosomal protein L29 [Chloroflexi bacterium]|nr:50S ribosomal protein L29 [Chloroflexota bacterium]
MQTGDIRKLNNEELGRELDSSQQELFNLRFRLATKQLTNYREIKTVKKKVARLKTIIREKELSGS